MVAAAESSVVSEWTQLQNDITNADDGSTIRVSGYDTDKDKTITASSTENSLQIHKSIILDLDGCTIYRGRPNPTENNNCVIYVDTSAILTLIDTVGGGTITGALTGRSVYINQGAGERVAVAEGNYVITESDASRLFSTTDEPMGKVIVNSDQGRFVYFKKKIKDGTISVTPEKPVYDGKTMTPAVTVKMGDTVLDKDTDYTVTFFKGGTSVDSMKGAGEYTIRVAGIGKYYCDTLDIKSVPSMHMHRTGYIRK